MRLTARLAALWHNLRHRERIERDLDREVRATVDLLVDEKMRAGVPPPEARRLALLEIGGVEPTKERVRAARSGALLDTVMLDVRYGSRLLRRNPIFALTAALSIAAGIGANTAIVTVANALLLRPPHGVAEPDRLVELVGTARGGIALGDIPQVAYPDYLQLRERTTAFTGLYGYLPSFAAASLLTSSGDGAERVFAGIVTSNYFEVLGVVPAVGRFFRRADGEGEGASPVVVLSHRFWSRRFDADPAIAGRVVSLNGQTVTVLGVAAEGFQGTIVVSPDLWIPTASAQIVGPGPYSLTNPRSTLYMWIGGRLAPGASPAQTSAELTAIAWEIERARPPGAGRGFFPGDREGERGLGVMALTPIPGNLRLIVAAVLSVLLAIVSLVLLIACANVAGVLLARAAARRREIAVRVAAGAWRARLVRQLLTETLLLFVLGGAAGLILARWLTTLLVLALPEQQLPVGLSLPLDSRVMAFTAVLSFVAALASGLVPALHASRSDVATALKEDLHGPPDRLRLRSVFVVGQVAASVLLVMLAALFVRGLQAAAAVDRGFDPRGVDVASIDLSTAGYTAESGPVFARELIGRVRALPGMAAATLADRAPDARLMINGRLLAPGVPPPDGEAAFPVGVSAVDAGYFATLRIPLLAGRDFTDVDTAGAQPVAIVAEDTARRLWPGEDPIGKYIVWHRGAPDAPLMSGAAAPALLVVGVAGDLQLDGPSLETPPLVVYVPLQQFYRPALTILARRASGQQIPSELRTLLASMDRSLPILSMMNLEDRAGPVETQLQLGAAVAGGAGLVGLLLAGLGIYGVTAYTVTQRTREIAVRLSLGAPRLQVVRWILGRGMVLVAAGAAVGLLATAGAARLLGAVNSHVPSVDSVDFATLGGLVLTLFAAIALAASYVPVRRAMAISLTAALRDE